MQSLPRCVSVQFALDGYVPRALIVFAVLPRDSTVSLLDRQMRFDYPERASAGTVTKKAVVILS